MSILARLLSANCLDIVRLLHLLLYNVIKIQTFGSVKMVKSKIGITLSDDTLVRLNEKAESLGLSKSQYISLLINQSYVETSEKK
ncbi:MAG: CopG family transcriptional regulator [Liquorilactobacillus nagelii]|uniref:ribbon-helix-helix domain-containing protein n=1 Tax=Liquorilactobacillus nagelii TaxID=82688 RepID=UPI0039E7FC44